VNAIDRVSRRAAELLDCMRRAPDGRMLLPRERGWLPFSPPAREHLLSLQAMAMLRTLGYARMVEPDEAYPHWPAFALCDAVPLDELDVDDPAPIRTSRTTCYPGCSNAEPEHGRGCCDECASVVP
jgi:hypothetical protein